MSNSPSEDLKGAARRRAFAARKAAKAANPFAAAQARDAFLGHVVVDAKASVVAGYRPIRTELDPTPLMEALHAGGVTLCVPVIEGEGQPLSFREWRPGCAMVEGAFGAEVPADGAWLEPDLLIAPLVAWSRDGWRLGYGGGFYDRTLERLRGKRPTRAFGYAYAAQELQDLPTEPTDQRLDGIVTETGVLTF
ncbi:MAG: 5-formyltetrahydrofolate cyclo-ligase [Pseudomonadota bacterium]